MGLRTPQELLRNSPNSPSPRGKFSAGSGSQIGTQFIGTVSKAMAAKQQSQEDFVDAVTRNKLKTAQVQAKEKLAGMKGLTAIEKDQEVRNEYETQVKQIMSEAPEYYRASARGQKAQLEHTGDYNRFSIGYTAAEGRKIQDETYKTLMANDMNDLVERSSDVEYVAGEGLDKVETSIIKNAMRTYGSDPSAKLASGLTAGDMIETEVEAGVSDAIKKSIQMQIASNRFDLVDDTVTRLADRITPDDRVAISKMVATGRAKEEDTQSLAIATRAYDAAQGDPAKAETLIRAFSGEDNPKLYAKAMQNFNIRHQIDKEAEKKQKEDAYDDAYDMAIKTGVIPQNLANVLGPEDTDKLRNNLSKNRGRPAVITDWAVYDGMKEKMSRMTDEDIVKLNLNKSLQHSVNVDDIKTLEKWQETARTRVEKGFASGGKYKTAVPDRVSNMFVKEMGIRDRSPEAAKIQRLVSDVYGDILIENPKITDMEVDRKLIRAARSAIQTTTTPQSTLNKVTFGLLGSEEKSRETVNTGVDSLRNESKAGLTPQEVRTIQSARLLRGLPEYTEDELIRFAQGRNR